MSDPWVYLADRHPEVKVHLRPKTDLGTRWGQTVWRGGVPEIHLAWDLGKVQRRCTLAHELFHVLHGPPCTPLCPDDEADVVEETARFLLPDLGIVAAALASSDLPEAAEKLMVTRNVLTERLDFLAEDEAAEFEELMRIHSTGTPEGSAACQQTEIRAPRRRTRRRNHTCRPTPTPRGI